MIRAILNEKGGTKILLFGLTDVDFEHMRSSGQLQCLSLGEPFKEVVLVYGPDDATILAKLDEFVGAKNYEVLEFEDEPRH